MRYLNIFFIYVFLNYILSSVRNKDQIPFHAVVLARGMLQPGGNTVPMFVYATEINGGREQKLAKCLALSNGGLLSRLSHAFESVC